MNIFAVYAFNIAAGYSNFIFSPLSNFNINILGNSFGNIHHIPSVSNSNGIPIFYTNFLAF